ncbi:MAG: hypothetical protein M4579_000488 [Chaenotheca gracillima]|nr:MAG: hypothetical protein M4579_000488 [Chaenotheca gracillima]
MIRATRNWFRRNRTSFAVGFGVLGAGYLATQYVLSKLAEARESMSSDRIARENLRRRFEQNQEDCTFTVLALLPTATENVLEAIPVESITHELQQKQADRLARSSGSTEGTSSELSSVSPSLLDDDGRSFRSSQSEGYVHASQMADSNAGEGKPTRPPKSKMQLWNDLKINSITRAFTLIYTLSLLTLLTRIQLNLLGRRNYLSSVLSLASPGTAESTISLEDHDADGHDQANGDDYETNRRYLTFSWWLLHRGWRDVMQKVEKAVQEVFGPLKPKDDITMSMLSDLTLQVRRKVEGAEDSDRKNHKWLSYLLPPPSEEASVLRESGVESGPTPPSTANSSRTRDPLRSLLDETSDLIDSPTFSTLITRILDSGFTHLIDSQLASQAFSNNTPASNDPASPSPRIPTTTSLLSPPSLRAAPSSDNVLPPLDARVQELQQSQTPPPSSKRKVASVLAVFNRQAHAIGDGGPNEYLQAMDGVKELDAFAAVIYSSNFGIDVDGGLVNPSGDNSPPSAAVAGESGSSSLVPADSAPVAVAAESPVAAPQAPLTQPTDPESGFESAWGKAVSSNGSEAAT